jgi:hypothetical protein
MLIMNDEGVHARHDPIHQKKEKKLDKASSAASEVECSDPIELTNVGSVWDKVYIYIIQSMSISDALHDFLVLSPPTLHTRDSLPLSLVDSRTDTADLNQPKGC